MSSITPFNSFCIFFYLHGKRQGFAAKRQRGATASSHLSGTTSGGGSTVATDGWGGVVNHGDSLVVGWLVCFFLKNAIFPDFLSNCSRFEVGFWRMGWEKSNIPIGL